MPHRIIMIFFAIVPIIWANAQSGVIEGVVQADGEPLPYVHITLNDQQFITTTDSTGHYRFDDIPYGQYKIAISHLGHRREEKVVFIHTEAPTSTLDFSLEEEVSFFDKVVVTGTKTFKRQTKSPVIVHVLEGETLEKVQACNVAEGLRFQPGLRVETDCQTCNYTQLRMNGLNGSYSQILINGRPIFSPLTGLYGMEQIPSNMLERIEVVRGAGSALYGSSAIGGTVNLITKIPTTDQYEIAYTHQQIGGAAGDHQVSGNATIVNDKKSAGIALFVNHRSRSAYDHNDDNFSELPELRNNSFGTNIFFQPTHNQKLEVSLSSLNEYRYGGELIQRAAHLAQQSEERDHQVFMGSVDYQINFNQENSSFIAYFAGQSTSRDHYTGILPDEPQAITNHLANPPYGFTTNKTLQAGVQLNHRIQHNAFDQHVLTLGAEVLYDDVLDSIGAYNYVIDQNSKNYGIFIQDDWSVSEKLTLLAGLRLDKHNLVDDVIFNPRLSLMYTMKNAAQFRMTWGRGFRAPQAFDTDLHIAFAGGGVSRITLDPELSAERSNSFSASANYDKATENFVAGFTLEGFYTILQDAFFLQGVGKDAFGERFVKQNGPDAIVQGATLEIRANYNQKAQIEGGFTIQRSRYSEPISYIDELPPLEPFLRTPDQYGYLMLQFFPSKKFEASANAIYTGPMKLAHFAGAPQQPEDSYVSTSSFTELDLRVQYSFFIPGSDSSIDLFGGVKNITNAYQSDFDTGKNRDSNYVYGPSAPRTIYLGLRLGFKE